MSTPIDSRVGAPRDRLSLQNVVQLATQNPDSFIVMDAGQFRIKAAGQFNGTHGSMGVAWVEPDSDATGTFLSLLGAAYSQAFAASIAKGAKFSGISVNPGQPLSAHVVNRAAEIAQTGAALLAGRDQADQWFSRPKGSHSGPKA